MTPAEIVKEALEVEYLNEKGFGPPAERTHCWASGWHPCPRSMALDLLHPEDRESPDADGCARMAHGSDFEATTEARLKRAGRASGPPFTVERQQEAFILRDRDGRVIITGKIEGYLRFPDRRVLFEIKGGQAVRNCRTLDDLLAGKWTAKYVRQILAYMVGTGSEEAMFFLDSGGMPTQIAVPLTDETLQMAEQFIAAATQAVACKLDGAPLPDFTSNPEHCLRCDHRGKSCSPPWYSGEGPYISTSPELAELVEEATETEEAAKRHGAAWRRLQDLCRGKELVLIGEHTITGRAWGKGWRIEIQKGGDDGRERDSV